VVSPVTGSAVLHDQHRTPDVTDGIGFAIAEAGR